MYPHLELTKRGCVLKDKKTFTMIDVGAHETAVFSNEIEKNYLLKKKVISLQNFICLNPINTY